VDALFEVPDRTAFGEIFEIAPLPPCSLNHLICAHLFFLCLSDATLMPFLPDSIAYHCLLWSASIFSKESDVFLKWHRKMAGKAIIMSVYKCEKEWCPG
jgi:hypothetical protein